MLIMYSRVSRDQNVVVPKIRDYLSMGRVLVNHLICDDLQGYPPGGLPTEKQVKNRRHKHFIALLIAAHNEELVLANTLRSAIAAGMKPKHIYVVDDNSSDATSTIARSLLPPANVCRVRRSGKGLAIMKARKKFKLCSRYQWIHLADADGAFAPNYFKVFRSSLRSRYAAATGYIRSLPGRNVSQYRVFEYTVGMEIHRRFQSLLNVIPVIPGPTSCFRSDVFRRVNFANESLTEDFDVTVQIHRNKLGKIQFIPGAVAYTQDPYTLGDFTKQISRWNRGVLQGMLRHRIGRKRSSFDAYLVYQLFQNFLFFGNYCIWIPYLAVRRNSADVIALTFIFDVFFTFLVAFLVAAKSRRWDVLSSFPQVFILRWVSMGIFLKSFIEVVVLRKYRISKGTWHNDSTRRYAVATS